MQRHPFTHDGHTTSLFTWTSAMSCWSWSIPAGKAYSCPAEHRGPNSICESCYAQQGNYLFRNVRDSQLTRFNFLREDTDRCFSLIADYINRDSLTHFRVHDSGDFHSLDMIHRWTDLVRRCPSTLFWFPTRTYRFPNWLPALRTLHRQPNACVRPSALNFGDEPPAIPNLGHGTVSMTQSLPNIRNCPKSVLGGSCSDHDCRTCWHDTDYVNYLPHGHIITPKERLVRLTIGTTT
jgi:hypothetical protein